jgi:tetratricopeptide (TPR) repeat protein
MAQSVNDIAAAHAAGRLAEARVLCERLLEREPGNGDAHMWHGLVAMAELRWEEAAGAFERALQARVEPWSYANLGACHSKLGRLDEAEHTLRCATELKPDLYGAHIALANVLHGLKRFDEALARLDVAEAIGPGDHEVDLRRGCTLAALGHYDEAQAAFERSSARARDFVYSRLVRFDRLTFEAVTAGAPRVATPKVASQPVADADTQRVVLVSCNPPYARKYGVPFIRSYAEHARPRERLHVHIPDPDGSIVDELRTVAHAAGLHTMAVTTESTSFAQAADQQRKAYYACARLVHLPAWLEIYRVPMLLLDVDFIVERPLDALFEAAAGHDLCLNARDPINSPWLDVIANVIVANPTSGARRYVSAVASYAHGEVQREPRAWLVDQTALYCVLRMFERHAQPPLVRWLPQAHQSGLFHIGHAYDHLLADPRFRRYTTA